MKKIYSQTRYLLFIPILLLLLSWRPVRTFAAANETNAKTVVRVGYTANDQMIEKKDNIFRGYAVDYLQFLSEYSDLQFEYVPISEENRIQKLKTGEIDLLCDISKDETDTSQLILSKENSCMQYVLVCAKKNDTSIFFNEYEALENKRIAVNTSQNMEPMLAKFVRQHQIAYTPIYCTSLAGMKTAVEEGRADYMLASNQRRIPNYKYAVNTGIREQFFAVAKDNRKLMDKLNAADHQLKFKRPFVISTLYNKHYGRPEEVLTGRTREEHEFIQKKTPVRVVCDGNSFPIAYIDEKTGKFSGVYADAMELIQEESGLNFEFVPISKYKNSWEMLKNNEADMSSNMYLNEERKKEYGLISSIPYLNTNYSFIMYKTTNLDSTLKIALPVNYVGIQDYIREHYPKWRIVQVKDVTECLKMTESKKVDATFVNSVFLQTKYSLNNYSNLIALPAYNVDIPISCAFSGENAELLCQIVNKAIRRIPAESFKNCITENSVKISYEPSMLDILRKTAPILLLLLFGFIAFYLWTLRSRERHYRHLAITDSITGLWNGIYFRQKASEILDHNYLKSHLMISMDIEHFRYVYNDFGEKTAEYMLQVIAKRLCSLLGSDAIYSREMGDMFLILAEENDAYPEILYKICSEIAFENNGSEQYYKPDIKFGIYNIRSGEHAVSVNEYIDNSLSARKSIKGNPNKTIAYYDEKMEASVSSVTRIEKRMETALKKREFVVYYQPKYFLKTEKIAGAEALVRWNDPELGLVSPNEFIPVFERNGFIIQLDFYIFEEVLKTIARWRKEGKPDIVISVNVSRTHIGTSNFVSKLTELADYYQVPHKLLELELTETIFGGERQDLLDFIHACKENGFPISIDDFGSGYSSLNLLKELPVDVLKIDREFLNESEVSEKSSIIIEEIVKMATKIQIRTLCEGVETHAQADFLEQIGCNMAQGYLYSKPIALENFEALLNAAL